MNTEATPAYEPPSDAHWRLAPGIRVHARRWADETALYFDGAGETMVVRELGATAIDGLVAGCSTLAALDDWCRNHGFADAGEELQDGLEALLGKLLDIGIIESSS